MLYNNTYIIISYSPAVFIRNRHNSNNDNNNNKRVAGVLYIIIIYCAHLIIVHVEIPRKTSQGNLFPKEFADAIYPFLVSHGHIGTLIPY